MPRLRLDLPPALPWTKVPNHLLDRLMPLLRDTELRILLILLRQTIGWNRPGRPVTLSYRRLMRLSGRGSHAIADALRSLEARGLIHRPEAGVVRKRQGRGAQSAAQQKTERN